MFKGMRAWTGCTVMASLLVSATTACAQEGTREVTSAPSAASAQALGPEQFNGYWKIDDPVFALRSTEGQLPPLTAEAEQVYREHLAARAEGKTSFDVATWCASPGYPRVLLIDYPFELIVRPLHVVFLHEWNWWHNIVYLDGALSDEDVSVGPAGINIDVPGAVRIRPEEIPGSMGFLQGQWQGSKLVVETSMTVDTTILDSAGLPHSDDLKITTTWQLRSPDVLEARFHFEDPTIFTRPWDAVVTFARQDSGWAQEDVCLDRIRTGSPAVKEAM